MNSSRCIPTNTVGGPPAANAVNVTETAQFGRGPVTRRGDDPPCSRCIGGAPTPPGAPPGASGPGSRGGSHADAERVGHLVLWFPLVLAAGGAPLLVPGRLGKMEGVRDTG